MAPQNLESSSMEDDFEVIDSPAVPFLHASTCGDPYCQSSHSSQENERQSDRACEPLIEAMRETASKTRQLDGPIFHAELSSAADAVTDKRNLIFETFASGLPIEHRRVINCTACKHFMRRYGDLCTVGETGDLLPLFWPAEKAVPPYYKLAVANVLDLFKDQTVGNEFKIFKESGRTLGIPMTNGWNHMSVTLSHVKLAPSNQSMESQDTSTSYTMLARILEDNSSEVINRVHHMIHDNQLPYATSHKAPLQWLKETSEKLASQNFENPNARKNLITKYARLAFVGCLSSLRGGMLGYLFECVREGQDFKTTKTNWENKADPLSYLRPTAAPTVGNIEAAEKVFAKLGYTPYDLERVYLTYDQIPESAILWSPATISKAKTSSISGTTIGPTKLFSHLLPAIKKSSESARFKDVPMKSISFRHFALRILPTAADVKVRLPNAKIQPFFLTSGKEGSKPIMSFHSEGGHTASSYTWGHKHDAGKASLKCDTWIPMKALISFPHMWDGFASAADALDEAKAEEFKFKRHGISFLFCLEGAREVTNNSLALFPTYMKGVFHPVRSTVEAFSNRGKIEYPGGKETVAGICAWKDGNCSDIEVGVTTTTGQVSRYQISLFD